MTKFTKQVQEHLYSLTEFQLNPATGQYAGPMTLTQSPSAQSNSTTTPQPSATQPNSTATPQPSATRPNSTATPQASVVNKSNAPVAGNNIGAAVSQAINSAGNKTGGFNTAGSTNTKSDPTKIKPSFDALVKSLQDIFKNAGIPVK